jgi:DNA-binding transcriptional MerR regulator
MLTIGRLAKMTNVTVDALRHYEREGVLVPEGKTAGGYRLYGEDALRRVNFIKHAQKCGFSVAEIRLFVVLQTRDSACCKDVRALAMKKKRQLDARIDSLTAMSQALGNLISMCIEQDKPLSECPLLSALERTAGAELLQGCNRGSS